MTGSGRISTTEFIALVAAMTSLVALAIDAMLPSLPAIGTELQVVAENRTQLVIAFIFIGMAIGSFIFGPLSDSIGRKPSVFIGLAIFAFGSLISWQAESFNVLLSGRILQGLGVAGPRIVAMAMVRDRFSGQLMARVMSFVTAIFILVPALAPTLGQAVWLTFGWRAIFLSFILVAALIAVWLYFRQEETLAVENRRPLNLKSLLAASWTVITHQTAMFCTIATGLLFGSFLGYLSAAQQLFDQIYGIVDKFPLYFAALALSFGGASLINARLVMRVGMLRLVTNSLTLVVIISACFIPVLIAYEGVPPVLLFMAYAMAVFMLVAMSFGNLNAMAMEPLGPIAGTAAAFIAAASTIVALPVGLAIGQSFNQTLWPNVIGFGTCGLLALWLVRHSKAETVIPD